MIIYIMSDSIIYLFVDYIFFCADLILRTAKFWGFCTDLILRMTEVFINSHDYLHPMWNAFLSSTSNSFRAVRVILLSVIYLFANYYLLFFCTDLILWTQAKFGVFCTDLILRKMLNMPNLQKLIQFVSGFVTSQS